MDRAEDEPVLRKQLSKRETIDMDVSDSPARGQLQDIATLFEYASVKGPLSRMKSTKPMAEVSIPGMSTIFGEGSIARRIIWSMVVILCISIACVQLEDRIRYYLSMPVSVNVRVTMNDSLRFPTVTFCNKNLINMTKFRLLNNERREHLNLTHRDADIVDIGELIGFRGMDVKEIWDATAHDSNKIIKECWFGRNITCNSVGGWSTVYTYMGVCYSFNLKNQFVQTTGIFNNLYVKLHENEVERYKGDEGWKVLIHGRGEDPILTIRTHGTNLNRGWGKDMRIYAREFKTLDTWQRPCDSGGNYSSCVARCFVSAAAALMDCRLPFMDIDMDYCSSPTSYRKSIKTLDKLLVYGHWSSHNCTCVNQCEFDIYVPSTEPFVMESHERNLSKLRIFYQDFTFDEIEESVSYNAVSLLCDIGGSLGFLLGISVLTIFEIVDATVRHIFKSARKFMAKYI